MRSTTLERATTDFEVPSLLVSVCSADEAIRALIGGADILDLKDPCRGSLGMADLAEIDHVAELLRPGRDPLPETLCESRPLSVALGELWEWFDGRAIPALPPEVTYCKLGLSQLANRPNWTADWIRVRREFDRQRQRPCRWVAVAYADSMAAGSPALDDVFTAAVDSECAGLLIDTFAKSGQSLLDSLSPSTLNRVGQQCRSAGLFLAIAGSLTAQSLTSLREAAPDIIAIRTAACVNANRRAAIDVIRVKEFRQSMQAAFGRHEPIGVRP